LLAFHTEEALLNDLLGGGFLLDRGDHFSRIDGDVILSEQHKELPPAQTTTDFLRFSSFLPMR